MNRKLILIELNELNFDVVREYLVAGDCFPNLQRLLTSESRTTSGESHYHLLEPWIQWPSVHTGMTFDEHNIFRLGDVAIKKPTQIFEILERNGLTVGAVSPMNAVNELEQPKYFIPDPWTDTPSDGSIVSRMLTRALQQTVNDNSKGLITVKSLFSLDISFIVLVRPRKYFRLVKKALNTRKRPWRKALFLDRLLHEMHLTLFQRHRPNFSTIFFNAGAHIQHHYFLNAASKLVGEASNPSWYVASPEDPFRDMLVEYDEILGDLFDLIGTETLIATGLTQTPVKEGMFYYRLRDHNQFFVELGLPITKISPRMTRDFLISCENSTHAQVVESALASIITRDGSKLFGEVDNRGSDLFVVLDYSREITEDTQVLLGDEWRRLIDDVVFVAVKNGEHNSKGFAFFSPRLKEFAPNENCHVAGLHSTIWRYFDVASGRG